MTGAEKMIDHLLGHAHQLAWSAGRSDLTVPITQAINLLRGFVPRALPDSRDERERDRDDDRDGVAS